VILVLVPVQYFVGVAIARARKNTLHAADTRVRLTEEVLRAIKLVKMYVWEEKFANGLAFPKVLSLSVVWVFLHRYWLCVVNISGHSKYTRAMTFENLHRWPGVAAERRMHSQKYSI